MVGDETDGMWTSTPLFSDGAIEKLKLINRREMKEAVVGPMHRVLLNVSCDPDNSRELKLKLLQVLIDPKEQSISDSNGFKDFVSRTTGSSSEFGAHQHAQGTANSSIPVSFSEVMRSHKIAVRRGASDIACGSLSSSFYRVILEPNAEYPVLHPAKLSRMFKNMKLVRHSLRGTGRIAFGSLDEVRPMFKWIHEGPLLGNEDRGRSIEENVHAALGAGHQAAMLRMRAWGEEWAEEEDLPIAGGVENSLDAAANTNFASKYHKEVSISSQRIAKLNVAKRKSKYNN